MAFPHAPILRNDLIPYYGEIGMGFSPQVVKPKRWKKSLKLDHLENVYSYFPKNGLAGVVRKSEWPL